MMSASTVRWVGSIAFLLLGVTAVVVLGTPGADSLVCRPVVVEHVAHAAPEASAMRTAGIAVCAAVALAVSVALLWSVGSAPHAGSRHGRNLRECAWALVPVLITFATAAPSIANYLSPAAPSAPVAAHATLPGLSCHVADRR